MKKGRDFLKTLLQIHRTFLTLGRSSSVLKVQQHTIFRSPKMEQPSEHYSYTPTLHWNPQVEEYFIQVYGAQHFSRISKSLTQPSCYSCVRVNTVKSTSDDVLAKLLALQENGWQNNNNNNNVDSSLPNPNFAISKCDISGLDYVLFVRGSGPHEIDYGFKEDKPPKEVIVSRKCAEAVLRGAQVYVPGVLACSAHVEKGEPVAVSVAMEQPGAGGSWGFGFTRGTVLQGSEADPYHSARAGLYVGQGIAMLSRAGMFRESGGVAVDMFNRVFKLPSFHNLLEGEIFLQNLPSIITAHALDPQEGEKILDMCAAPGGKTTAIAILMKDKGEIIAVDRSHNKVHDIQKLAAEMGLKSITTYKLDALKSVQEVDNSENNAPLSEKISDNVIGFTDAFISNAEGLEQIKNKNVNGKAELKKNMRKNGIGRNKNSGARVEKSKGFLPNSFDRVLLDAPCSALGLRPRLFAGQETVDSLRAHATYQRRMLDQAVQLVRPGGVLVYSTCTINPGENESLVRYALDKYIFLSLASQHPRVGGPGLVGGCQSSDGYKEVWLRPGEEELVQRFDPSSPLDTLGFFIAKFNVGSKDI